MEDRKDKDLIQLGINTVRVLSADAVQKANSGHPGTPMALAPVGHVLWTEHMRYNPEDPGWPGRDRFVLSCGHACMLQYSFLFLTGYAISLEDIKNFRQLDSRTAGHPEYGLLPGIEVTTGPLGQGFGNGVGMAIAQQYLAGRYNKPGFELFNYRIYAVCSDGDIMEGISSEAASLAGHLGLGNMVYIYDNNHITIEGKTDLAFNEDVAMRFEAYGWHVQSVADVNNLEALSGAIEKAKEETDRPSLIVVRSHIAYGSPNKMDTKEAHGAALGEEEVRLVKEEFGFDPEKSFVVPDEVLNYYKKEGKKGKALEAEWNTLFEDYKKKYPALAEEYMLLREGGLPDGWDNNLPTFTPDDGPLATRKASGSFLNKAAEKIPTLIGGAADLAPSTGTNLKAYNSFTRLDHSGRNFHFGIREHAMGAIVNGMAVTNGIRPFGATFLIFSDYMRPAVRLAAIMQVPSIFVYTHDSIGLGEDGTTHQPVEQLISLRAIPGLTVIRPADANETVAAWKAALLCKGPVALAFTRQKLPIIDQENYASASGLQNGAYILSDCEGQPDVLLIGTGSEVQLVLGAQEKLMEAGISSRVISMPSWELFEQQDVAYKQQIFPDNIRKRLAVEAGSPIGWLKYVTEDGAVIGVDTFGESAPGEEIMKAYGFTVDHVVQKAKALNESKA